MNFKTPNICAEHAYIEMQFLVYFEQITPPKIQNDKKFKTLFNFLEKIIKLSEKTQAFWLQNSMMR